MKIFKKILIVFTLLSIFIYISAFSYVDKVSTDLQECIFRLHIVANSNSMEDQALKFKIRDNIINYMNTICYNAKNKLDAMRIAKEHSEDFYKIAKSTVEDFGFSYDVSLNFGNFDFPTKYYGDICLPAGNYDALKIELGNASGQNWWCVMFPPLCFVDISSGIVPDESKEILQNTFSNKEEFILINEEKSSDIKLKFKLFEMFNDIKIKTAKK